MRTKLLLLPLCVLAVPALTMCESFDDTVPAAGLVRANDPAAAAKLKQAADFKARGELGDAESLLKEIRTEHALSAEAPMARFMLAQIYEQEGDYREAFREYDKLIARYQDSPLYTEALNRQLAMATAAANGKLKTDVLWGAWQTDMESAVVKEWFLSIIRNAPYNDLSATAASQLGKYLYDLERYEEARQVYKELTENYPDSRYAPQAQLMVANIWATDRSRGNQDMVNLDYAREAYEEFTLRFPNHPDAGKALKEISNVKRLLVEQDLEVGRYYLDRSHEYQAAIFCFENVIRQKSVNPQAAAEASRLLVQARQRAAATQNAGSSLLDRLTR